MMRIQITCALSLLAALSATSCKDVACGEGTIERDGRCEPATATTGAATCGPFTELHGDRCVPQFPPTECDPFTTIPDLDPETGVTTCIGTGGGGCSAPFACPTPTAPNRLTICGQLYDLETNAKFATDNAAGAPCEGAPAASGPCALAITPFDAVQFASGNPQPLPVETSYIDDCGRYRLVNIDTNGTSPFIGLGIDDAGMPFGPGGVTVTVGVATGKSAPVVTDFEAWIVKLSTVQQWATSGGPSLQGGIYVASYRKHKLAPGVDRHAPQEGVVFASMGTPVPANEDHYFVATETEHRTIDPDATATGANGTALVTNRSLAQGSFDGAGGLGTGCRWEPHAAASVPGVVFIQLFRKADLPSTPGSCQD